MSHLAQIPERKCNRCKKRARYELVNDRSAVIGYYCSPCGLKALYAFQHPPKLDKVVSVGWGPQPETEDHVNPEGYVGPFATKREADDAADALRKAGLS